MKAFVFSCYSDVLLPTRMASNFFYNISKYSTKFLYIKIITEILSVHEAV